jgi:hypothetical protein
MGACYSRGVEDAEGYEELVFADSASINASMIGSKWVCSVQKDAVFSRVSYREHSLSHTVFVPSGSFDTSMDPCRGGFISDIGTMHSFAVHLNPELH